MTPTLSGRWQSRLWLILFLGIPFTFLVGGTAAALDIIPNDDPALLQVLVMVLVFGWVWDIFYQFLLRFRWDYDWPPVFQFLAGIWEWIVIGLILWGRPVDFLPEINDWWVFHIHYWTIWTVTFIASQSLLRILFPRWRFRGGQFGSYK